MLKIGIIGLGWVGEPLAKHLAERGHEVFGTVTASEKAQNLQQQGIHAEALRLPEDIGHLDKINCKSWTHLVLTIPPTKWNGQGPAIHQALIERIAPTCRIIFLSSTGVYEDVPGEIDESATIRPDAPLAQMELFLADRLPDRLIILRFAGLVGPDRNPGKFLAGKTNVPNPNHPVNMIHQNDCVALLVAMIENHEVSAGIFHAAHPAHPSRQTYFTKKALEIGLPAPEFGPPSPVGGKIIVTQKIEKTYGFRCSTEI